MDNYKKIEHPYNKDVVLRYVAGHFVTPNSHVNYYMDLSDMKCRQREARATGEEIASLYSYNTQIDTILCLDNMEIVGAYVAKFIAKKFSTRNTTIIVFLLMAAFLFLGYFMRLNSTAVIAIMSVVQLGYGVVYSCTPALYADAAVYGEWKTGRNATGVIMGLQTMTLKIGILARSVVVAACLAIANFDASIDPSLATDELKSGVSVGFMVIPAVGLIVGAILLFVGFRITKARVIEMQAEIDARKAANA